MTATMDEDRKPGPKRPNVLRKLNAESLNVIERGLLGDLPDRLKPNYVKPVNTSAFDSGPVRGNSNELVATKPSGFLSSCLLAPPDSPDFTPSDEEANSPIKKSFSFRQKLSRISFLKKNKTEKPKCKSIIEDEKDEVDHHEGEKENDDDYKANKRFWLFRNKELMDKKGHRPFYKRSKSFEFLPKGIDEEVDQTPAIPKKTAINTHSLLASLGSKESMGDAWASNDSLDFISNVCYDNHESVFLKSVKELSPDSSKPSSVSTCTASTASTSSGLAINIFSRGSVQDLLDEFDKTVELLSENYVSDCEPYTNSNKDSVKEKRKSASFSTLPSPKVIQVTKVSEISDDFKEELTRLLDERRDSVPVGSPVFPVIEELRSPRRGSATDCFVLENNATGAKTGRSLEVNKHKPGPKKPVRRRVRRTSSTKYWITPEECAVYSREQRPPLVIPRITQYRAPRREPRTPPSNSFREESPSQELPIKPTPRQYERLQDWSPTSERSYAEMGFNKASSDSPPFSRLNKRFGGSTENLLQANRRPNHLQLPASSSGDSLDVEVRGKEPGYTRSRKSRSMVAPKHRMRSPVPAPRTHLPQIGEATVLYEGPIKRTKFYENGKKCSKKWVDCYMVLTNTALYFYKDQKTYYATKIPRPPGTPPSPSAPRAELVLPLKNAHAIECIQMHTRRYTKSIALRVGYDEYLLQHETEEGMRTWLKYIQTVYYKLGPKTDEEPMHYQSSNTDLESLGRTPPVSRHANRNHHKAGGSSNEDLSDSTEVSLPKSHVKRRLRNFFAKRPTMDSLVKKGIYQEEPVFGRKLEEVCPANSPRVPEFVVACVREIEGSEENMTTDGLYRASGNLSQVQKIRLEVDQNNLSVIENNTDIHVLTGSLKLFFRELKEPLIPCSMFDRVLAACSIKPRDTKIKEFRDIVQTLPPCNRDTLKFLLEHLLRVTQYSERNRMHTANLAIVFGPTLLWAPAEQAHNIAIDCIQQNHVVEILLNDYKEIFEEKTKKKS